MKNLTALFLFTALLMSVNVDAQVTMTATAGVSPQQTPTAHYIFVNRSSPRDEFTFDLSTVKASYFIGVGARYDIKPFSFWQKHNTISVNMYTVLPTHFTALEERRRLFNILNR